MLDEFKDRIDYVKNKQYKMMDRFHIGDTVYPFWLKNFLVYGIVVDIDTVARKIICDFNGIRRQFCPEDLMLVNPNFLRNTEKTASVKKAKAETHLSPDTDNGIDAVCKECGGEIAVSYDEKNATSDFVCTQCGKRIPENKISQKTKKAMRKMAFKETTIVDSMSKLIAQIMSRNDSLKRYHKQIENVIQIAKNKGQNTSSSLENLLKTIQSDSGSLNQEKYYNKLVSKVKDVLNKFNRLKDYDEVVKELTEIDNKNNQTIDSMDKIFNEMLKVLKTFG